MENILNKYLELSKDYNYLCFKIKKYDYFIIGIFSNNGPIINKLDLKYYDLFNVEELSDLKYFNELTANNKKLLYETDFNNVSYFMTNNNNLIKYYGNAENVIIPNNIKNIYSEAFKDNIFIKSVTGLNVEETSNYTFKNNINLEKIIFPKCTYFGAIENSPNLRELTLSDNLFAFYNKNNNFKNIRFNVNDSTYEFDSNLDKELYNKFNSKPYSKLELSKISKETRKYKCFTHNDMVSTITGLYQSEYYFNNLPVQVQNIFYETNHSIYVVKDYPDAGGYLPFYNTIILNNSSLEFSFYHEIGHMLDFNLANLSNTEDFITLYNLESKNLYTQTKGIKELFSIESKNHFKSSKEEYFAECFQRYMENDYYFKLECPSTYEYFNNLIHSLKEDYSLKKTL